MSTALDIITDALQSIGVYSPGEVISASDSATSLTVLNDMIDQWNEEYIPVYALTAVTANIIGAQAAYNVGNGHAFNVSRPISIAMGPQGATALISAVSTPINVVSQTEWEQIESKNSAAGTPPLYAFYDPQYPIGILNINPAPAASTGTITINAWVPAATLATLSTSNTFAAGGVRALKTNLAIRLQPYFLDGQISQSLAIESVEAKDAIRYTNQVSRAMMRRYRMQREPRATPV